MDFLPLDRAGNRRFLPVLCDGEQAECHILDNEEASRAYIEQVWAEAMAIYRSGEYSMKFSKAIREQLVKKQRDFMPEDVTAGKIVEFLGRTDHDRVCCQMLHTEALDRLGEPKKWESHGARLNADDHGDLQQTDERGGRKGCCATGRVHGKGI